MLVCVTKSSGILSHSIALQTPLVNTLACEVPFLRCYGEVCNMHVLLHFLFQVIADFDMTLTKYYVNGKRGYTSYGKICLMHCYKCAA